MGMVTKMTADVKSPLDNRKKITIIYHTGMIKNLCKLDSRTRHEHEYPEYILSDFVNNPNTPKTHHFLNQQKGDKNES